MHICFCWLYNLDVELLHISLCIKLPAVLWIIEKAREFQKNIYLCFSNYAKAFDCVDHNKLWKAFKEMGIPGHLTCLQKPCMQVKKQQLEPCREQLIGSRLRKE